MRNYESRDVYDIDLNDFTERDSRAAVTLGLATASLLNGYRRPETLELKTYRHTEHLLDIPGRTPVSILRKPLDEPTFSARRKGVAHVTRTSNQQTYFVDASLPAISGPMHDIVSYSLNLPPDGKSGVYVRVYKVRRVYYRGMRGNEAQRPTPAQLTPSSALGDVTMTLLKLHTHYDKADAYEWLVDGDFI